MPPKKVIAGRQSTLGSFFSLPAGVKPPAKQQSTLAMKKERPLSSSEDEAEHPKAKKTSKSPQEDVKTEKETTPEAMEGVEKTADETKVSENESAASEKPTKKRARTPPKKKETKVKEEEEDKSASEEEPISKKGRKAKTSTPRKAKSKSPDLKPEVEVEEEAPVKSEKKASPKASPKRAKKEKSATPELKSEPEDVDPDDEIKKPAISLKARKVMQTKLTTGDKFAYPDWPAGTPVPYEALIKTFTLIESTTKRLEKLAHTSLFLRQVLRLTPDELLLVVHLMINRLAADYEGIELGIGESLLMKAICESCGRTMSKLKEDQREIGDLGEVAMKSRNTQKTLFAPKPLTVKSVHAGLKEIATTKGDGGQGKKVACIKKLLSAAKGDEAKFLVRGLEGKLRLGLAERTVIVSLSQAVVCHEAEQAEKKAPSLEEMTKAEEMLKTVYSELPNYEIIITAMMKGGIMNLNDACKLQPGVPLKPMLAKPTKSITEVLDRFEDKRFTCEYKYDGERVQIHYVAANSTETYAAVDSKKGIQKIFSRNSEELSPKYPDILAALPDWVSPDIQSFVLDCEAVAWDRVEKRVLPFQQLMTRKRKDVAIEDVKVRVCVFGFDLLFLNGISLVQTSLSNRRDLMHSTFQQVEGEFAFATHTDGQEAETIQTFLDESIKGSCEGLMVKMLDGDASFYEPSKRSRNWLKVKKDYLAGAGDSLDLVVIGAYHGKGKRTSVYGAFLLACYNPATQVFESICNIGTGFSEVVLEKVHAHLSPFEIEKPKPYYLHSTSNVQQPDVWFEPRVVWEVKAADLSLSPKYMAAKGLADHEGKGRGISLRFPRFIRERDDKKPEDATSGTQVAEMYERQDVVVNNKKGSKGVDDDFEY